MYIKLTNASQAHKGNTICIRKDLVVTILNATVPREDGSLDAVTFIFCPPHGTWEVSESVTEVLKQLNADKYDF